MKRVLSRLLKRFVRRIGEAPPVLLAMSGIVLSVGGATYAYRTYDYVQHDNDFCISCHLMEEPFERFSSSVHRGLSCKACHQPNPLQRARMGLRQVVVHPEEIEEHAEVPDSRCEHCHMEGEAEDWVLIRDSRGHEIHLASLDPALRDLECVGCHSSSVHQFRSSVRSCSERGCHMDADVRLATDGHGELRCEACHDFRAPLELPEQEGDPASLTPSASQCLSCHEMRERLHIDPETEPHGGVCGVCHNVHTQRSAPEALTSCSASLCHTVPEAIEDDHHQWRSIRLDDCVQCHEAHTFRVDAGRCGDCHADLVSEGASTPVDGRAETPVRAVAPYPPPGWIRGVGASGGPAAAAFADAVPLLSSAAFPVIPAAPASQDTARFTHERHRSVECRTCHADGTSVVRNDRQWCNDCHHRNRAPGACARCHDGALGGAATYPTPMHLPGGVEERLLTFPHARHQGRACTDCHGSPPGAVGADFTCAACHDEHHESESVTCLECHSEPPRWAHEAVVVHQTCAGGICHKRFPPSRPEEWGRSLCLACHPDFEGAELPVLPSISIDTLPPLSGRPPQMGG